MAELLELYYFFNSEIYGEGHSAIGMLEGVGMAMEKWRTGFDYNSPMLSNRPSFMMRQILVNEVILSSSINIY